MGHNLCIIDDAFMQPAVACEIEQYTSYSGAGLDVLLKQEGWNEDTVVRDLCKLFLNDIDKEKQTKRWNLRAFSNPEFFINAFNDEQYRSDIIIFDWEYSTGDVDQIDYLKKILRNSHTLIFIYSRQNISSIEEAIKDPLSEYLDRVKIIEKHAEQSYNELCNTVREKQESDFAFKFGNKLRNITSKSINDVLFELSNMNFDSVVKCLISQHEDSEIAAIDSELKQIIGAKIKDMLKESPELHSLLKDNGIPNDAISEFLELTAESIKNNITFAESFWDGTRVPDSSDMPLPYDRLWSYRLYYTPRQEDQMVRTGDIIRNQSGANLYFVLNGDCSLQRFWKDCGGQLLLVEIVNIASDSARIKNYTSKIAAINSDFKKRFESISSLTNGERLKPLGGAPVLLPYVPVDGSYSDFLLFPLRVSSLSIPEPSENGASLDPKKLVKTPLSYEATNYERVCSVSEPFVGPLKWAILSQLYGWGSPDYPVELQKVLAKKIKDIFQ
ncbi:hypothetical protein LJC23_02060 [Desulfovibrio sp. OttesenSCG-928-I05]|nr:hypothetical protein [Desulfovibrio sp. OttesenSCG-928-I05]